MNSTTDAYRSRTDHEPEPAERLEPVVWGDPTIGPWIQDDFADYDRDGFTLRESLLTSDELEALDADLERLLGTGSPDERYVREPDSDTVRSIFQIHQISRTVGALASDARLLAAVETLLGSAAYIHQSRVNFKPALRGKEFYWHSDFETWHFEDGMPQMRAVSVSINLTENTDCNGSLMIMPGSHRTFVGCVGMTPDDHYRQSLRAQNYGIPSDQALSDLCDRFGITQITAPPGSAVFFDSNCMHGSNSNITPQPRRNIFLVYNSVENTLVDPYGGTRPRPDFIAARNPRPLVVSASALS